MLYSKPFRTLKHLVAAAAIATWASSCIKTVKSDIANSFYDSMSTFNKDSYNALLIASEDKRLYDGNLDLIKIMTQWNDTLSAYTLLSIHTNQKSPFVINDLEDFLYLQLFKNKELLTQIFIQVWAINTETKKDILTVLAEKEGK